MFPFLDLFRAGHWFALWRKNFCARFFTQVRQIGEVIGMGVRQQNHFDAEVFLGHELKHAGAIRAGIERDGVFRSQVPNQIGVHQHSAETGGELRQALEIFKRIRFPFSLRKIDQRVRIEIQNGRNRAQGRFIGLALAPLSHCLRGQSRFFR